MSFSLKIKDENLRSTVYLFGTFLFVLFLKIVLTHYFCFGYIAFSSLWEDTGSFVSFYVSKFVPALFMASIAFVIGNKWWTGID